MFAPGVNDTDNGPVDAVVEPEIAFTAVGAAGEPTITAGEAEEDGPVPAPFVPLTLQVYDFAVVRPVTVTGLAEPEFEPPTPPLLEVHVAVKLIVVPPLSAPGVNDTDSGPVAAVVEPDTALTAVGASGASAAKNEFDGSDCGPSPCALCALTVHA